MSGFNQQQQQRMRMMYNQPQSQQQQPPQINNPMNRTPGQGVMRPGTNVRPEQHIMPPHQSPILPQQQQQQLLMQQQLQQQSPAQPMPQPSPQTQQPLTPSAAPTEGQTTANPNSPSVGRPATPSGATATNQPQSQSAPQQSQQAKEINTVTVCRIGQETVQEIVSRMNEVFSYLKVIQPPTGSNMDKAYLEKQQRLQEVLAGINSHFKRLHVCWDKAHEHTASMEYTQLETLIPFKEEKDMKNEIEKKRGESYKLAMEEHNELIQQLAAKNRHIKEIIDQMRNIIWEINTMLAMR